MAIHSLSGKRSASYYAEDGLPESKRKPAAAHQSALRVHRAVVERGLLPVWRVRLPEEWEPVAAVARSWIDEALDLRRLAEKQCLAKEQIEVFWNSYAVNLGIFNQGPKMQPDPSAYRVGVCMGDGREQGIMVAMIHRLQSRTGRDLSTLEIDWLATRPGNLCPNATGRLTGVGRSLVEHARSLAREEGISYLVVSSFEEAQGFYERCGFMGADDFEKRYNIRGLQKVGMTAFVDTETSITHS